MKRTVEKSIGWVAVIVLKQKTVVFCYGLNGQFRQPGLFMKGKHG